MNTILQHLTAARLTGADITIRIDQICKGCGRGFGVRDGGGFGNGHLFGHDRALNRLTTTTKFGDGIDVSDGNANGYGFGYDHNKSKPY